MDKIIWGWIYLQPSYQKMNCIEQRCFAFPQGFKIPESFWDDSKPGFESWFLWSCFVLGELFYKYFLNPESVTFSCTIWKIQRVHHEHNKKFWVSFKAEEQINMVFQFGEVWRWRYSINVLGSFRDLVLGESLLGISQTLAGPSCACIWDTE